MSLFIVLYAYMCHIIVIELPLVCIYGIEIELSLNRCHGALPEIVILNARDVCLCVFAPIRPVNSQWFRD